MDRPVLKRTSDMSSSDHGRLINFSKLSLGDSTGKSRRKIRGAAMSLKPLPPLIALSVEVIPIRLLDRLRKLDAEQLQIVEIVAIAIARGHL